jgi:sterol desaturase/sphingolipid hydroxylase (fatty acid hydroxylase superfamily)
MILSHVPLFALLQWLTGWPTFWGAIAGCTLYFAGYEYTHYLMHVPRGHPVERFGWFRFLREHHRLHHKYMLRNLNVFIPLADICLGTLVTAEGWRSKPGKRERRRRQSAARRTDPPLS